MRTRGLSIRSVAIAGLLLLPAFLQGCGPDAAQEAIPEEGHGPGSHAVVHDEPDVEPPRVASADAQAMMWTVQAVHAEMEEGPGGESFLVAVRTPEIGHYPCTDCHIRPIGTKDVVLAQMHSQRPEHVGAASVDCYSCHNPSAPAELTLDCAECHEREGQRELMPSRSAHLTVALSHPSGQYRNCLTCHAPENPGLLALQGGGRATMNEAYRLCEGCHFSQARDWAGGAHGKRVALWQGERVIQSCTGCHNPHDPSFPVRRPVTFPKIARREASP